MRSLFDRIMAGYFLALALALTCSINYYYEEVALSSNFPLAIGIMAILMFCCIMYSTLSGGKS